MTMEETTITEQRRLLLRPEEAARVLGLGRTKVYELMSSGALRSVKVGNSRRISTAALGEFVDQLDQEAGAA